MPDALAHLEGFCRSGVKGRGVEGKGKGRGRAESSSVAVKLCFVCNGQDIFSLTCRACDVDQKQIWPSPWPRLYNPNVRRLAVERSCISSSSAFLGHINNAVLDILFLFFLENEQVINLEAITVYRWLWRGRVRV